MLDDNALFRTVVMPYIDEAYRLARWLTANGTDAEDVVQDASLRAFRAIRSYAGGNPRAWLLSIVRNTAYSWLRKNRSATIVSVDDLETVETEHGTSDENRDDTPEASLIAKSTPSSFAWRSPICRRRSAKPSCCATSKASTIGKLPRPQRCRSGPSCHGSRGRDGG